MERRRLLYRMHQVVHRLAVEFSANLLAIQLCMGSGLIIVTLYSTIKLLDIFNPAFPAMAVIAFNVLRLLFQLAYELADSSRMYVTTIQHSGIKLSKYDKKFLKSCYPLDMHLGPFVKISKAETFTISVFFIFDKTIDLLLANRE